MTLSAPQVDWMLQQRPIVILEGARRAATVKKVELLRRMGWSAAFAVSWAAADHRVSASAVWAWLRQSNGYGSDDFLLFALVPRRGMTGVRRRGAK